MGARLGQPVDDLGHRVVGGRHHQGGGHDAARLVLGVAQELAQGRTPSAGPCAAAAPPGRPAAGRAGRRPPRRAPWRRAAAPPRRGRTRGAAARGPRAASPRGRRRPRRGSARPAARGARRAARSSKRSASSPGRSRCRPSLVVLRRTWVAPSTASVGLAEGLDGGPVDDAVGRRAWTPPARAEPAQQAWRRHVGTDEPDAARGPRPGRGRRPGSPARPSTSTSWWSRTSLARSTSPGRRTTSRRSSRAERRSTSAWRDAVDGGGAGRRPAAARPG